MNRTIVYFTVEGISSSVFESQVYAYISRLRAKESKVNLIVGQRYKARIKFSRLWSLIKEKDTKVLALPVRLNYKNTAKRLLRVLPSNTNVILHCRNPEAAYIGYLAQQKLPNLRVLYDVRGWIEEELKFFNNTYELERIKNLHKELFSAPIYFNFVSTNLKEAYEQLYDQQFHNYSICVSAYNDEVFKFSPKTNENYTVNLVFVGGNQTYQQIDKLEDLVKAQPNLKLHIITHRNLGCADTKNIVYYSGLTQAEVAAKLDEMDYGIIYRTTEKFNQVATPTKIAEYWGKGLAVIGIGSAGAYTQHIEAHPFLGDVFTTPEEFKQQKWTKLEMNQRKQIAAFALNEVSHTANIEKYRKLYNQMQA